ncbi:MAG: AtpZ/AtpI family protein [Patescibacteria group bacterium]
MDKLETSQKTKEKSQVWYALSLAWQLGYSIAVPLVLLALLGRILDKRFDTSPWLLLAGVLLSLVISTFAVYFKTIKILGTADSEKVKSEKTEQK